MQTPPPGPPPAAPTPPPPPPDYAPAPYGSTQQFAPTPGPAPGLGYAGFWMRFVAVVIDGIILTALLILGNRLFVKGIDYGNGNIVITEGQWWYYIWGIVDFLYLPVTWAWLGQTLGHRILGMEIRRVADGQRPGLGTIIVRWLSYYLSAIIIFIGFIIAALDPRKQALHDKLAGTVVVRKLPG
jgi:uncharacterized RDD family membrane protein YckC